MYLIYREKQRAQVTRKRNGWNLKTKPDYSSYLKCLTLSNFSYFWKLNITENVFYPLLRPLWQSLRPIPEVWRLLHWATITVCLHETSGLASALKSWMNDNLSHMTHPSDIWKPIWSTPSQDFKFFHHLVPPISGFPIPVVFFGIQWSLLVMSLLISASHNRTRWLMQGR